MLDIWPPLPIYIRVPDMSVIDDNVLAALEEHDRICKVHVNYISDLELDDLAGAMQVTFPALTDLRIYSCDNTVSFSESFLGGSAPNLRSLDLARITFPALPKFLLFSPGLVHLSLFEVPHSGDVSPDAMVEFLSSLTGLETLEIHFPSTQFWPAQASRHPAPLTRIVFPVLKKLHLKGEKEYLEHILAHISVPPLDHVDIGFLGSTVFDISRISQWIGRTKMFEAFDQAYMLFDDVYSIVMLSSRKGAIGGKMLKLSLLWIDSAWKLQKLTLDFRDYFFEPFDLCKFEESVPPNLAENMDNAPWLYLAHFLTATEYIYLSQGVAALVAPALQELTGTGVAEVLPVLRTIFVERLDALGPVQETIGQFVATRRLLSGHPIDVQCWAKGERESTAQGAGGGL